MDNVPPRDEPWVLSKESFDRLLSWLDPEDCEEAGKKLLDIRSKLEARFKAFGCLAPDILADKTIDRVAKKVPEIEATYVGEKLPYFFRVGRYVHLEELQKRLNEVPLSEFDLPAPVSDEDVESVYECLENCLAKLPESSREMFMLYYKGERSEKIENRKKLAEREKCTQSNLRLKAHRIREKLRKCIRECLARKSS